ncbi:MAG: BatD family protein, partial [Pseudomonadales bacterium]|nr:BatD family protein [Pseudomonadales bacterium]
MTVQVDRKNITDAELLQVNVRIDNPNAIPSLEWRNLSRDFDVISLEGPNQNRSVRIVNGQQTSENY